MTNTGNKSSCSKPSSGKKKAAIWLSLVAVSATVGALLGNVYSGLMFGLLLGMLLVAGGG